MGKIPKRKGQAINGLGISIMSLIMLLLLLPLATVAMMEISQYLSDDGSDYHNWENGSPLSNPPDWNYGSDITTQMGQTSNDTFYSSRWLSSGNKGGCSETGDRSDSLGSVITSSSAVNGTAFDLCRYPHSTAEFASEYWSLMYTCGELQASLAAIWENECGDDRYSLVISDYKLDYDKSISRFSYQALNTQSSLPCDDVGQSPLTGNISFQYSISIQVWKPIVTFTTSGAHLVEAYHPDIWSGVMTVPNWADDIAQDKCLISLDIVHELSISEQLQYSQFDFGQYEVSTGTIYDRLPIIHFIIDIDNMYDEDSKRPKSLSNLAVPFEQVVGFTSASHFYQRFQVSEVEPEAITVATTLVSFGVGGALWLGAIASTPAWTPLGNKLKELKK